MRPDRGDPPARFEFSRNGRMKAVVGGAAAAAMVDDFGLNREDLRKSRRLAIGQMVGDVDAHGAIVERLPLR